MNSWHSALLGIVQGLTEFLPVSSSAHLVLLPWIVRWSYQGLAFDVALHWGTLFAVLFYFRRDWVTLARAAFSSKDPAGKRLAWGLVLATLPAVVVGLLLKDYAETILRKPPLVAGTLIVFGILLGIMDRLGRKSRDVGSLSYTDCLLIGCAQALALVPGVSRSGVTLTMGLFLGLRRDQAARFSFLLSMPVTAGAGVLELRHLTGADLNMAFVSGVAASAVSGMAAIWFLLDYVRKKDLGVFVFYRVCLGVLILLLWASRPSSHYARIAAVPQPGYITSPQSVLPQDAERLQRHVKRLASDIGERNLFHPESLNAARDYIVSEFKSYGHEVRVQEFDAKDFPLVKGRTMAANIEVVISAANVSQAPSLVIGAHYDSAPYTPGADDNASGVAVLLDLARRFSRDRPARQLRLVAFSTEEPPAFGTDDMGSRHYAKAFKESGTAIEGMISLEMLGYY
ncbi:MAG: undecaprenyl-diphosphate phosphatase, partial [Elusimicrobiota bacterium]